MKYTTIVLAVVVGCAVAVVPARQPELANIAECDICKLFEPVFAGLVGKEEPEVEAELNKICDKLPVFKSECTKFVDSKLEAIVKALNNGGPDTVCAEIGACKAANFAIKIEQARETVRAQVDKIDPKCLLCHLLGPTLEKLAGKEEPVIQKELDTICERVLGWEHKLAEDCVNYINKEGAMIAKVLAEDNGSGAKELCEKIGWCPSTLVEAKVTNLENPLECDICKAVGPELEKLAGQKEPVVVKDLEIVCSKLSIFKQPCDNWVEKEGAMIAKVLTEDEGSSAHVLCQKLHMCDAVMVKTETNINVKCDMCAIIGPGLEELAKREEPVVAKDLEHICKVLSFHHSWETACDGFIMKEGDKIAQILTEDSGSGAHELCKKIGWC